MTNLLVPLENKLVNQKTRPVTDKDFIKRLELLANNLIQRYDSSKTKRKEYEMKACQGSYNFGKTLAWVYDYAKDFQALESIASGLEAIVDFPHAGSLAWKTRRFINFSQLHIYDEFEEKHHDFDNIHAVIQFGNLLERIGKEMPYGADTPNKFSLNMVLYWENSDGDSEPSKNIEKHGRGVYEIINGLKRFLEPGVIDIAVQPSKEQIEKEKQEQKVQYRKDFLADAKSFHKHHSFFDILNREEIIKRPQHRILTFPVEIIDTLNQSGWKPEHEENVDDIICDYYREHPYMIDKREKDDFGVVINFHNKFEERLNRTLQKKPWLIDFSVRWQELFGYSNVIGNRETRNPGRVEYIFKNPSYRPNSWFDKNEHRQLVSQEEKQFIAAVVDIEYLGVLKTPEQTGIFNGIGSTGAYKFHLSTGQSLRVFINKDYGSIYGDGKLVVDGTGDVQLPLTNKYINSINNKME